MIDSKCLCFIFLKLILVGQHHTKLVIDNDKLGFFFSKQTFLILSTNLYILKHKKYNYIFILGNHNNHTRNV